MLLVYVWRIVRLYFHQGLYSSPCQWSAQRYVNWQTRPLVRRRLTTKTTVEVRLLGLKLMSWALEGAWRQVELTPRSTVISEKLTAAQLVKKSPNVHKNPPPDPLPSQMTPCGLFPPGFSTKILYAFSWRFNNCIRYTAGAGVAQSV